jgi:cold shock CspA family protein
VNGEMIWFNSEKGFGYIRTEAGERIRVYESGFRLGEVPVGRCAGNPVVLTAAEGDGERIAVEVAAAPVLDVRRARLRQGRRASSF